MVVSTFVKSGDLTPPTGAVRPQDGGPVHGSGNFLADRGYTDPDETRVKFLMCNEIAVIVDDRNMTQAQVAEMVGIAQSHVSRIVNGNVKDYSVWRLMRVLNRLGTNITMEFSRSAHDCGQVSTRFLDPEPDDGHAPAP